MSYVKKKKELCEAVGAKCSVLHFKEDISITEFLKEVATINNDKQYHGIIIQLPLPNQLNSLHIYSLVSKNKDVDGFHNDNAYNLYADQNFKIHDNKQENQHRRTILPCTPAGILDFLNFSNISVEGKKVVVIGRSYIVGKPLVHLFLQNNATVVWCHSKTSLQDLKFFCKEADIIASAMGKAHFLTKDFFHSQKPQLVIDIGINKLNNKICGDLATQDVQELKLLDYTPVPSGVGPLTVVKLIENLLIVFEEQMQTC